MFPVPSLSLDPVRLRPPRLAQGPRVLVVVREPNGAADAQVRALAQAGYRCTVLAADEGAALWRVVRKQLQERDYRLIHADGLTAAGHAWLGSLGMDVPFVVSIRSHLHGGGFSGLLGQAKRWFLGRVLAEAVAVLAPSNDGRANLLRVFPNLRRAQARVHVIPPGINMQQRDTESMGDWTPQARRRFDHRSSARRLVELYDQLAGLTEPNPPPEARR